MPTSDLQIIIVLLALAIGAVRGGIGYYLSAPESEDFNPRKVAKSMVRYAIVNLVGVNLLAVGGGITWTATSVVIYTLVQLGAEMGIDMTTKR